jgi:uncharacterized protein YsxB (DUF464 family)
MITVTVKKRNNAYVSFTSSGHAGYAEHGQDIVCAAVSALIINTVNSIEQFTDDVIKAEEKDGFISFTFQKPITERGTLLMDSLVLGLTEIEHSYKNRYLTIKVKEV